MLFILLDRSGLDAAVRLQAKKRSIGLRTTCRILMTLAEKLSKRSSANFCFVCIVCLSVSSVPVSSQSQHHSSQIRDRKQCKPVLHNDIAGTCSVHNSQQYIAHTQHKEG